MIIFLRKIPADAKRSEIEDFVAPALKGGWFRKAGKITKIDILALHDKRLNTMEFHGLVTVEPEAAGIRAIRILKGRRFKNKLIVVRQYFQRNWQNDPRQHSGAIAPEIIERRVTERRRGRDLEVIEDISNRFSSHGDFVRKG